MSMDLLLDPLFRVPFAVGFVLSLVLAVVGVLLRLRDEWLAALGLAHLAGAGSLIGMSLGVPAVLGAPLGAVAAALVKSVGGFSGNTVYGLMILVGWSATLLVASNTSLGSVMGHALVEGQLYFAGKPQLVVSAFVGLLVAVAVPWLMPRLIRAHLFPGHEIANELPAWQWHVGFDVLAALSMAIGAASLGLMGAFALVFVPAWVAFRLAKNWRSCLWISLGTGVLAYVGAFVAALALDQPFGPVLVAILLAIGAVLLLLLRRD